jgi:outer membrane protein assembly factor BamB
MNNKFWSSLHLFNGTDFTSRWKYDHGDHMRIWKRVVVACFTVLFLYPLGQTEKFYEKLNQEIWKSGSGSNRVLPEHNLEIHNLWSPSSTDLESTF